jgi:SAUR family protein
MLMMGYFRAPKLGGRKSSSPERSALLVDGETASVPKGYFAVYVGAEARRFVVPMSLLCQPAFRALMERAAEEFGFGQAGGLRIPCREEDFVATVAALVPEESRQRRRNAAGGRRSTSVNW